MSIYYQFHVDNLRLTAWEISDGSHRYEVAVKDHSLVGVVGEPWDALYCGPSKIEALECYVNSRDVGRAARAEFQMFLSEFRSALDKHSHHP